MTDLVERQIGLEGERDGRVLQRAAVGWGARAAGRASTSARHDDREGKRLTLCRKSPSNASCRSMTTVSYSTGLASLSQSQPTRHATASVAGSANASTVATSSIGRCGSALAQTAVEGTSRARLMLGGGWGSSGGRSATREARSIVQREGAEVSVMPLVVGRRVGELATRGGGYRGQRKRRTVRSARPDQKACARLAGAERLTERAGARIEVLVVTEGERQHRAARRAGSPRARTSRQSGGRTKSSKRNRTGAPRRGPTGRWLGQGAAAGGLGGGVMGGRRRCTGGVAQHRRPRWAAAAEQLETGERGVDLRAAAQAQQGSTSSQRNASPPSLLPRGRRGCVAARRAAAAWAG